MDQLIPICRLLGEAAHRSHAPLDANFLPVRAWREAFAAGWQRAQREAERRAEAARRLAKLPAKR